MRRFAGLLTFALAVVVLPSQLHAAPRGSVKKPTATRSATVNSVAGPVTITTSAGRLTRARLIPTPSDVPGDLAYPVGFFGLKVTGLGQGAATKVSLRLPDGVGAVTVVSCSSSGCARSPSSVTDGDRIAIQSRDGGAGDADGVRNGVLIASLAPAATPCPLENGEHVVHEWEGTVGTTFDGLTETAEDIELFELPAGCSLESATVRIEWDLFLEDIDLSVTQPDGETAVSDDGNTTTGNASEVVTYATPAAGTYEARAYGFTNIDTAYSGTVDLVVTSSTPSGDGDLDGVPDAGDNCAEVFNPSQTDADGDDAGDACDEPVPAYPADAQTQVFVAEATSGLSVQPPPIGPGADFQGTGFSQGGELERTYAFTLTDRYDDYSELEVRLDWDFEFKDYLTLEVQAPSGQILTGIFVNTNYQEVFFTDPVPGEYTVTVRESRTTSGSFSLSGFATRETHPPLPPLPPIVSDPSRARVVVADLDSAINPYHSFYYAGSEIYPDSHPGSVTQEVLAAFGVPPSNVVQLTRTGNLAADLAADASFWNNVEQGELYHFRGTNIIATSLAGSDDVVLKPDVSKSPHGVGTSGAVLKANPDAVLLFVEANDQLGSEESHALAFQHPAVDMVTTSYGFSVAAPVVGSTGFPMPEHRVFEHTHDGVVTKGKLHFSSGGNGPGLTPARAGAGPWWSIGVSGIEEGTSEGDTALSGNFPDFVSDFTQDLPYCMDCESGSETVGGTSFSTPRAAGVASKVLLETRTALGHAGGITVIDGTPTMAAGNGTTVTNWTLRRALEQAAWIPDSLAYDPIAGITDLAGLPIVPVAPWLQTAWGDLTADPAKGVVAAALSDLGLGTHPRVKPAGYCEFQTAVIEERKLYWNEIAPNLPDIFGGEVPPGAPEEDPFVYC